MIRGRRPAVEAPARSRSRDKTRSHALIGPSPCAPAAAKDEAECAICFEALSFLGGAVPLPCACRAPFCHTCWDRALAASIAACGLARCPSCRCSMRVDFDVCLQRLVFSRAEAASGSSHGSHSGQIGEDPLHNDWQHRLYQQAKPTQIHLLQLFGGRAPQSLRNGDVAVRPWWPWPRSSDDTPSHASHEEYHVPLSGDDAGLEVSEPCPSLPQRAAAATAKPQCVCGSSLRRVSVQERVWAFFNEEVLGAPPPHVVDRLLASPPIFCDICERRLGACQRVWTCENGRRTVLHAAAYDVCEACFELHVHGDTRLAVENSREDARSRWKGGRWNSTWT